MNEAPQTPPLHTELGTIPPARSGNVAFFANLQHIFFDNEALKEELSATVHTLDSYGGRLLPVIGLLWDGPQNILILERPPLPGVTDYLGGALGLRVYYLQIDGYAQSSGPWFLDVFVVDP